MEIKSSVINQISYILKIGLDGCFEKESEALLSFGGYDPDEWLQNRVETVFPAFREENTFQAMSTQDGRVFNFFCSPVAWAQNTFVLFPVNPFGRELKLLQMQGENLVLKMENHPAILEFSTLPEVTIRQFNQLFSIYYDILVHVSGDHNSFYWHVPSGFSVDCQISSLIGLLGALQSYRFYFGNEQTHLTINLVPFSSNGNNGFKIVAEQKAMYARKDLTFEIGCFYLWLQALAVGFQQVAFNFGTNEKDVFSFTFLESNGGKPYPHMLIGQRNTFFSDQSLWMLRQFQLEGIRFFDSLEAFIQNALCTDPIHCLMTLDFGSFSSEEMKAVLAPLKEHKTLSIVGSSDQIRRVPSYWRGPAFIQTGQLALDLDRLFSFFSKREKSLKIQFGRL